MAAEEEGGERGTDSFEAAAATRRRVAEAVQAPAGAEQVGDSAELAAGGAVFKAGRWLHRQCHHEDVRRKEQFVAWGAVNGLRVVPGWLSLHHSDSGLMLVLNSMGMALWWDDNHEPRECLPLEDGNEKSKLAHMPDEIWKSWYSINRAFTFRHF